MASESFSWKDSFKLILWKPTIYHNLMRSFFSGLFWCITQLILSQPNPFVFLALPIAYIIAGLPMGAVVPIVSKFFPPYKWATIILALYFVVPGDIILYIIKKFFPKFGIVESIKISSFALVDIVMNEDQVNNLKDSAKNALKTNAVKTMQKFK